MKPYITVIIPTYNRAHLLPDAMDSVLSQTYEDFELLVVDDHSTDNTEQVVKDYSDSRIKHLKNNRTKGAQGARNTGIFAAKGEWLAFLDSDDFWVETKLEKQLCVIKNRQDLVGVSCGFKRIDIHTGQLLSTTLPVKKAFQRDDIFHKNIIGGFSVFLCRKSTALSVGGVDESFPALQDRDFYTRLLRYGKIYAIDEPLVKYRINNKERISSDEEAKLVSLEKYLQKYNDDITKNSIGLSYIHHRLYLLHKKLNHEERYKLSFRSLIILMIKEPKAFLKNILSKFGYFH